MPLENRNNAPNAVFVPTSGGLFRRFNSMTGRPMDAGPADAHGLHDRDGRMHFGPLPAGMALDAMPSFYDQTRDPKPPTSGAVMGSRGPGAGGAITREQAAAIHDACHHAGCDEVTMEHLGKALSAIVGPAPAARDQNGNGGGGGQKMSHGAAKRFYDAISPKLSPADCQTLIQKLMAMVDPSLPDEDEGEGGQTGDQPPPFKGMPQVGGKLTGDAALAAYQEPNPDLAAALSSVARIRPDDHYGEAAPPSRYLREARQARMALDERQRGGGGSSLEDFARDWPEVARIGRAY